MNIRSTRSMVTFSNPFTLPGHPGDLPAGDYEFLVEEELLQGLSFKAYGRTAIYLNVNSKGAHSGRSEMRVISESDLKAALGRGMAVIRSTLESQATLSPQEALK